MISRAFGVSVLIGIVAQPATAAQPIGDWKIEPSDLRCIAVRQYGDSARPVTLALKASLIGSTFQLAILRSGYRKGQLQTDAKLTIDGQDFTESALSYPSAGNKRVTHLINLESVEATAVRTAKSMKISIPEGITDTFPLGPLSEQTLRGLSDCVERLQVTWNIGEEKEERLSVAPKANAGLSGVVSGDDYPRMAQRLDQQGKATFLILIDEKGMPKDCSLIQTSGSALLDSRTCGVLMERARFSPALDGSGTPVRSSHTQSISWRLEG